MGIHTIGRDGHKEFLLLGLKGKNPIVECSCCPLLALYGHLVSKTEWRDPDFSPFLSYTRQHGKTLQSLQAYKLKQWLQLCTLWENPGGILAESARIIPWGSRPRTSIFCTVSSVQGRILPPLMRIYKVAINLASARYQFCLS